MQRADWSVPDCVTRAVRVHDSGISMALAPVDVAGVESNLDGSPDSPGEPMLFVEHTWDKVGETGRLIGERITERQRDVRLARADGCAVAERAWNAENRPNQDEVACVVNKQHW